MIKFDGHDLILGATGAGKGVLTAGRAEHWLAAGGKVFLLCNKDDEYEDFPFIKGQSFKTKDQERFLEAIRKLKAPKKGYIDTLAVIDEAWDWDWKNKEYGLQLVPNMARSFGVKMIVQSQFPTQMAPTVRGNCDNIYAFRLKQEPARWAAKEYHPKFAECANIEMGRFIAQKGMSEPFCGTAWFIDEKGKFQRV